MAKVGYIFLAEGYDTYEADIQWMKEYGCVRIIEEKTANERLRPDWRQLLMTLERVYDWLYKDGFRHCQIPL